MIWTDKFKDVFVIGWIFLLLVAIITGDLVKQGIAWLLTKLYELFIGSRDHIAPI